MTTSIFTWGYAVLAMAALATWIISHIAPSRVAPLGTMLRRMMTSHTNRIAILAIWWWIGWHFFGQPFPN